MPKRTNRDHAEEFLTACDEQTDVPEWDPELVTSLALTGIGYAILDLTDTIKARGQSGYEQISQALMELNFPDPRDEPEAQTITVPPVVGVTTVHPPTITQHNEGNSNEDT